jgi:hypothetical protein
VASGRAEEEAGAAAQAGAAAPLEAAAPVESAAVRVVGSAAAQAEAAVVRLEAVAPVEAAVREAAARAGPGRAGGVPLRCQDAPRGVQCASADEVVSRAQGVRAAA